MIKYIAASVKKQGCQVIEVENVEPEDGILTERRAVQDDYYYPNYDASANGCVDLMNYVKRVTVTVNGVDYTLNQLDQMRQQGTPADHAGWRYHLLQRAVRFAGPRL